MRFLWTNLGWRGAGGLALSCMLTVAGCAVKDLPPATVADRGELSEPPPTDLGREPGDGGMMAMRCNAA